jgi:hypothetical protein
MADPAAEFRLFSWMRQGLLAGFARTTGSSAPTAPGRLVVPVHLAINGARGVDVPLQLHGPGDVTGLDVREVIRTEPQHFTNGFEPNYFPIVEFDRPDFPWLFTPAVPDGDKRLRPWICLVAVRKESATLTSAANQPLPVLECPRRELPDLEDSWAWAHAQVVANSSIAAEPLNQNALKRLLKASPERTLSRLLCARRLDPDTAYYACLVPAYDVGRKSGMGEPVTPADEQALNFAWSSASGAGADDRIRLPVYFHWEFSTGLAGDFESLARRLEPRRLPGTVGLRAIDVSNPGWGMPRLQPDAPGAVLDLGGALQTPDVDPRPWPAEAQKPFQKALRDALNAYATENPSSGEPSVVAPPLYGQWYARHQTAPAADGAPHWFGELNLDPRHRIAAGLGTLVIRFEQEQLMASAWDQLAKRQQDNQRLQRAQLAESVGEALVDKHLKALPPEDFLRLTGPLRSALARGVAARSAAGPTPLPPARSPALSSAFRRLTRSGGPVAKRVARITTGDIAAGATARAGGRDAGSAASYAVRAMAPQRPLAAAMREAQTMKAMVLARVDPQVTVLEAVRAAAPDATSTDLIRFAPEFPQPMYEPLRDYFQGMLLPGLDRVPPNTIALLETNQRFIEAYMVGLNHEFNRELLWRGFPTNRTGTCFRQFWDVRGRIAPSTPTEREKLTDITPIASWVDDSRLGEHAPRASAEGQMVLLIRGELLRRFPRAMIYAVEGVWSADRTRREIGTTEQYPMFRATQAPDITMLGFLLTEQQVRGADDAAGDGHPGWFFVLQEQPTEPRFGLDVPTTFGGTPQHWRDLTWGHLAADQDALDQIRYVPIVGLLEDVVLDGVAWGRNSAQMASITRQRPFRVAIHARTWLSG